MNGDEDGGFFSGLFRGFGVGVGGAIGRVAPAAVRTVRATTTIAKLPLTPGLLTSGFSFGAARESAITDRMEADRQNRINRYSGITGNVDLPATRPSVGGGLIYGATAGFSRFLSDRISAVERLGTHDFFRYAGGVVGGAAGAISPGAITATKAARDTVTATRQAVDATVAKAKQDIETIGKTAGSAVAKVGESVENARKFIEDRIEDVRAIPGGIVEKVGRAARKVEEKIEDLPGKLAGKAGGAVGSFFREGGWIPVAVIATVALTGLYLLTRAGGAPQLPSIIKIGK